MSRRFYNKNFLFSHLFITNQIQVKKNCKKFGYIHDLHYLCTRKTKIRLLDGEVAQLVRASDS